MEDLFMAQTSLAIYLKLGNHSMLLASAPKLSEQECLEAWNNATSANKETSYTLVQTESGEHFDAKLIDMAVVTDLLHQWDLVDEMMMLDTQDLDVYW
jgi:ribosomal 30S subunit maturation factor RimM